jgi:mono/diheme cytochrome c family protein
MRRRVLSRWLPALIAVVVGGPAMAADNTKLAQDALAVLQTNCHRCHGKAGAVEGGMNYVLDRDKLLARRKIVAGKAELSPLFRRVAGGKMPPAGEQPRPSAADIEILRRWIEAGAPGAQPSGSHPLVSEAELVEVILADLEKMDRRSRRFARYFTLAALANAGAGPDELQTHRNALARLVNSLSWRPRVTVPRSVDPAGIVVAIDLRDYQWDANLWNRVLAEYPYGVVQETSAARAVLSATASRLPYVRLDWFVATACRPPLYYEMLQIPANAADLERQLRVDVLVDLQQDRAPRLGFNGSGISRNNRVLERHDSLNGAYWRTYDFDAVPANLLERNLLLPDRRNIFAYPLGPGGTDNLFQHAGGEIIFDLPNGLHGYMLVNANNQRIDKGPIAIVSDPKRPDRAVEPGVSCMACHFRGINPKDDQIRDHVLKNAKVFSKADRDVILAQYIAKEKMRALMDEDAAHFKQALEKTGNHVTAAEPVMAMTLRYEADVDLPTLAAEAGLRPEDLQPRLAASENLARNLGTLKVAGATVARQVVVQGFLDVVREFRLGTPFQPGVTGPPLPDNTGEADPLESQSSPANAAAFSPDGRSAAFAANDRSVRLWDVEGNRELRRLVGHTASVWCVAFSADGKQLLSGGKDGTVRLWDVESGTELRRMEGHDDLVVSVAFAPDGKRALSGGLDDEVYLWDLERFEPVAGFSFQAKHINHVAFAPDGKQALVSAGRTVHLIDPATGKVVQRLEGHTGSVVGAGFSADGQTVLSGGDDHTLRLWKRSGECVRVFSGHEGYVKSVALSRDGRFALSGATDATVRLWDAATGKEMKVFRKHTEPLAVATFIDEDRATLSVSRDAVVQLWRISKIASPVAIVPPRTGPGVTSTVVRGELRPAAEVFVGGTIGGMHLSANHRWLYYLNLTESRLEKMDLASPTPRLSKTLALVAGTETLCAAPDGRALFAFAPDARHPDHSLIQVIDPQKMEVRRQFSAPILAHDAVALDGGILLVSGVAADWADVAVIDSGKQTVLARWGGVWTRSALALSGTARRLFVSSRGVSPGTLESFPLPARWEDRPAATKVTIAAEHPLGGAVVLSPDSRYLVCQTGTVLRLSPEGQASYHAAVSPFTTAAIDPEASAAFVLTRDGTLEHYSYPDFRLQGKYSLGVAPLQAVCDSKSGKLYVAGIDPRVVADRPRARGHGAVYVYALKELLQAKK